MIRSTTLLNEMGDTTIVWTEEDDDKWEEIIAKKMKEGVTFFIVERRAFGLLPPKRTQLTDAKEARKHRAVYIPDEDILKLVESGAGEAVSSPDEKIKTTGVTRDPKEAAKSQTVGVKPRKGG